MILGSLFRGDGSRAEDGGLAARAGSIVAVGSRAEAMAAAAPGARVIDAGRGTVLPGFRDAHVHLLSLGRHGARVDLHGLALPALRDAVRARAATLPPGAWLEGAGWSLDALSLGRPPAAADLGDAAGGRPVLLFAHDFHSALLSAEGIAALGLLPGGSGSLPDEVVRDGSGRPTGLLRESAVFAAGSAVSASATAEDDRAAVLTAARGLLAAGITAADDMDGGRSLRAAASLRRRGGLPLRIRAALREKDLPSFERAGVTPGVEDDGLCVTGLKLFLDGALGSRTAWMLEPYDDDGASTGIRTLSPDALDDLVRRAAALGLPCFVHAIGDAAVRAALDALARAPGLPHRVEHAQCIHPDDVPRFAALGVEASVQPGHMATDIPVADRAWGRRGARAFPLRDLLDGGAILRLGSDAPVEVAEPLRWIHAATERRTPAGHPAGGWWPGQRISRAEALRLAVSAPFRAGGPADVAVYPEDLFAVPADRLLDLRPSEVLLGGVDAATLA